MDGSEHRAFLGGGTLHLEAVKLRRGVLGWALKAAHCVLGRHITSLGSISCLEVGTLRHGGGTSCLYGASNCTLKAINCTIGRHNVLRGRHIAP